jgi:uncharacterized DUF497 family protein
MHFDWDSAKAESNLQKHKVSFEEACSVFMDPKAIQFYDDGHSSSEDRFVMLGMSSSLRVLVVCHAVREPGDIVRIISARKATRLETRHYKG